MYYLLLLAATVLIVQIVLFVQIRKRNRKMKEEDVLFKYKISSRSDAWRVLADPELPDEERRKIRAYYDSAE